MEYRFERLNKTNLKDLPSLFMDAFNLNFSLDYLHNKFNSLEKNNEYFSFVAYDESNQIVGLYAIFPFYITNKGEKVLAGQIGDIMIHSQHRKRPNLFFNLANRTHENAKQRGMKCLFTFIYGKKVSYPLFTRYLDFVDDENYVGYNIKVNTLPLSSFSKNHKWFNYAYRLYFSLLQKILIKKRDTFLYTDKKMNYPEIIKDSKFLQYKFGFSNCEIWEINKVRFLVKLNRDGSLGIGDIDKCSPLEAIKGIQKLKKITFWMGIRIIQFEMSEGHFLDQLLHEKYEKVQNRHLLYFNLDEHFSTSEVKFAFAELDTY